MNHPNITFPMSIHPHSSWFHRGLTTSPCQQTQPQPISIVNPPSEYLNGWPLLFDHVLDRYAELKDRCAVLPQQLFDRVPLRWTDRPLRRFATTALRPCAAALNWQTAAPFCHNSSSTVCSCAELTDRYAVLPQHIYYALSLPLSKHILW